MEAQQIMKLLQHFHSGQLGTELHLLPFSTKVGANYLSRIATYQDDYAVHVVFRG